MISHGKRTRQVLSPLGTLKFARQLKQCPNCKRYFYPADENLGLSKNLASKRFAKICLSLLTFVPFKHCIKFINQMLRIQVSQTFLSSLSEKIGTKLYEQTLNQKSEECEIDHEPEVLYIQADGSMVPTKAENKVEFRENKLGLVFTNEDISKNTTKNGKEQVEIKNKRFVTSLAKGVGEFSKMLYTQAKNKGLKKAKTVIFLSDGAAWLRKNKNNYYPEAIQILDWYHVVNHLWSTAHKLFGEKNKTKCENWVLPFEELLWNGKVKEAVIQIEEQALKRKKNQTPLWNLRTYLLNNENMMNYPEYRKRGFFIGSGAIESANKYIVANRMKRAGMRWSIRNANALMWLRCKYFEEQWEQFWDKMHLPDYLDDIQNKNAA